MSWIMDPRTPQITNPGGLWDESQNFYPRLGGIPHLGAREWRWRRGGKINFAHLQFVRPAPGGTRSTVSREALSGFGGAG